MAKLFIEDVELKEATIGLKPDDFVFLYTDGVTEAMNQEMEEFGLDRLIRALPTASAQTAGDVVRAIVSAVDAHSKGAPRSDDVTLLVVKRQETP